MHNATVLEVIRAYDRPIVRLYSLIRFHILRQRFLDEIGQYLPDDGRVLDVGCGFGLFSLYYARTRPAVHFHGIDLSDARIGMARLAAERLGLANVSYEVADATEYAFDGQYDGAYALDMVHHIPEETVRPVLEGLHRAVRPGGRLLVKDVGRKPAYKRWFTWALDKLMGFRSPVRYWATEELQALLADIGFGVHRHAMVDYLPYPHVIYICRRNEAAGEAARESVKHAP